MLNVAIIGAGIGTRHLDGFAQLPDTFDVRFICDLPGGNVVVADWWFDCFAVSWCTPDV